MISVLVKGINKSNKYINFNVIGKDLVDISNKINNYTIKNTNLKVDLDIKEIKIIGNTNNNTLII